nr:retrovirus-related Pol polyprotein from transposon TNT 1-94 [Tanacetum cinerariifolium]
MKNLSKKGLIKVSCNLEFCKHCVFSEQKRHKDEVFPTFKEWKVLIENQTRKKIKKLRTDNGLEFCGDSFNALCRNYGIARHHTLVRTPQQNDVAERMNRTIMEKVRCMLSHANLDKDFWVEAATIVAYLINCSLHRSLDGNISEILWSAPHFKLSSHKCPKFEEEKEDMSRVSYSSAVGCLMYTMVCTRPVLVHAISVLALLVFDTLRGAATTTMKSYGFWFKAEIVGIRKYVRERYFISTFAQAMRERPLNVSFENFGVDAAKELKEKHQVFNAAGVSQPVAPTTAKQRLARKNELKARGTLLMALPDKHQLNFNSYKDAKTLITSYSFFIYLLLGFHMSFVVMEMMTLTCGIKSQAGSESRPPMLNKENYVPWSSRLLRPSAPIIEDWVSDSEEESEPKDPQQTSNSSPRVNAVKVPVGNLQIALQDKGVIDSECSKHMTGNMSYLSDFEELNGGYVA